MPPEAVAILGGWFKQKRQHLLHYAFARLRAHDLALPTALLPETIAHAQKHPADITDCLLGARGRWLFAEAGLRQNSAADADEDWQLLPFAARKDWLTRLRHEAPDQAREQLAALWSSAPANHRQDYIAILADNLTAADQPFLTAALKDRSKTVKESAHRLLARLTPAEREVVLATPGLDHSLLSRSYNNSEIFDPAQPWGPLYSRAVFEGILHSTLLKKYGSTNDAERCAVCLDTRATADTIAALPAHPAFMDSTFLDALYQYAGEKQTFLDLLDSQS